MNQQLVERHLVDKILRQPGAGLQPEGTMHIRPTHVRINE